MTDEKNQQEKILKDIGSLADRVGELKAMASAQALLEAAILHALIESGIITTDGVMRMLTTIRDGRANDAGATVMNTIIDSLGGHSEGATKHRHLSLVPGSNPNPSDENPPE